MKYSVYTGTTLSTEGDGRWDLEHLLEEYGFSPEEESQIRAMKPGDYLRFDRGPAGQSGQKVFDLLAEES